MEKNVAIFIDADNAPASKVDAIYNQLASYGRATIRRAYGDWTKANLKPWLELLNEHAITPVMQQALTTNKNASDIALVIDAMDVMYEGKISAVALVSSDCDFAPLATRLRASGIEVFGFGERKAPQAFTAACSKFFYLDVNAEPKMQVANVESDAISKPLSMQELKSNTSLINLLRNAISAHDDDDGWAPLGPVGSHINNQTSFDQSNYGFKKLVQLFEAIDLFEVRRVGTDSKRVEVRDRRAAKHKK
ncbi:MAG: NYN domain-containing protein [Gammaproteobacteria bacterium]|nr:NYN domain-containing protein [Gammaproteobacteria bacterium]